MRTTLGGTLNWQHREPGYSSPLASNMVHIWAIPLVLTSEQSQAALNWLNDHQRSKYERRPSEAHQQVYLAGRYFLLKLLSSYCGCHESEVSLAYSRLNKPFLQPNPENLAFNFTDSHSEAGKIGIFAFYMGEAIGVDIESRHRRGNFDAIARRKLSNRERAIVTAQDGKIGSSNVDAEKFLALWTRKEAYGKATGQGVNYRMNQLDLASPDTHQMSFKGLDGDIEYQLHQPMIGKT